ncbi:hypothetical protein N431DRAFT_430610 [Stipitochalara longipes BDJ]|nr:hypothetical protein N431DRAFT_430610 [Stipitochalara longipes BDJ]
MQEPASFSKKRQDVCVSMHRSHYDPPPQFSPLCFLFVICSGIAHHLKYPFYFYATRWLFMRFDDRIAMPFQIAVSWTGADLN